MNNLFNDSYSERILRDIVSDYYYEHNCVVLDEDCENIDWSIDKEQGVLTLQDNSNENNNCHIHSYTLEFLIKSIMRNNYGEDDPDNITEWYDEYSEYLNNSLDMDKLSIVEKFYNKGITKGFTQWDTFLVIRDRKNFMFRHGENKPEYYHHYLFYISRNNNYGLYYSYPDKNSLLTDKKVIKIVPINYKNLLVEWQIMQQS